MKKLSKKLFSLGLISTLAIGAVGCSSSTSSNNNESNTGTSTAPTETSTSTEATTGDNEVTKPEKIKIMVNGTWANVASGQDEYVKKYKELTGIQLEIVQPDHNAYNDQLAIAFASGIDADVVVLGADYYAAYAAQGALWDMSDAWENSEAKKSGLVNEDYVNALYIDGGLYGWGATRGNGCITYLRKDWLDNLGLAVPTTYDEYVEVLRAFTNGDPDGDGIDGNTYGVTAAGIMGGEAPYINYLPEFWQDAYPDFYQKDDNTWVDGFSEQATQDALQRLKDAYAEGIIDMEVATNKTSTCRDKFYAGEVGAFTYWAGKWNATLEDNVRALFPDAELVAIEPIKEVGTYVERQAPVLAITQACDNPEGVFKYLMEYMVDGGEGQQLFTYGVENVHWEVQNGQHEILPSLENPSNKFPCVANDPMLLISDWKEENPFLAVTDPRMVASNEKFVANARIAPIIVSNDVMAQYKATLLDIRTVIVADVVTGTMTVEQGMAKYQEQAGAIVEEILASLN